MSDRATGPISTRRFPSSTNVWTIAHHTPTSPTDGPPFYSTVWVNFKNGKTYAYQDVPISVWQVSDTTHSAGKFVHRYLKGKFRTGGG